MNRSVGRLSQKMMKLPLSLPAPTPQARACRLPLTGGEAYVLPSDDNFLKDAVS